MKNNHISQLEKLSNETQCSRDFLCKKSGFEDLPKVEDIYLRDFVEVVGKCPPCEFSVPFGYGAFCNCPVRVYIIKKLGK